MDAPTERDGTTPAFVAMTRWLREAHLSAPDILAADPGGGLLLLEDLGDDKVADIVAANPDARGAIYDGIIDLLILLRTRKAPSLSAPDAQTLVSMTKLAEEFYPGIASQTLKPFYAVLETVLEKLLSEPLTVSLRDFHADNLMWLPDRSGLARLGLLDYQDAFVTHPVYDLVSLLTDARTPIDSGFRQSMIDEYALRATDDPDRLRLAFATFSAQRNLRILGIFCRGARLNGHSAHIPKLPRVHGYFAEALSHPVFSDVAVATLSAVPEPSDDMIEALT